MQPCLNTLLNRYQHTLFKNEGYLTSIKQSIGELSLPGIFGLQFDDIPPPSADKIRGGGFFWLFCIGNPQNFVYFADYKTEKMLYT